MYLFKRVNVLNGTIYFKFFLLLNLFGFNLFVKTLKYNFISLY
jgi:hypothetical protein